MPMKVAIVEDEIRIREGIEKLLKKLLDKLKRKKQDYLLNLKQKAKQQKHN